MKFKYSFEKNVKLLSQRGIGFEEIIAEINNGNLIEIVLHPNQEKYPQQEIMYVKCLDYVYLVPYVIEKDNSIFLKTIFPSRKATKKFLG